MPAVLVANFRAAERSVRARGALTALGILVLDWIARLNEHIVLAWITERLREAPFVVGSLKWAMDHPFLLSVLLLLGYLVWVVLSMRNAVMEEARSDQAIPIDREFTTITHGDNSPAATVGSIAAGAAVHVGNIFNTSVGHDPSIPSVIQLPIMSLRGRYQRVSLYIGSVAKVERGRWKTDLFLIELKNVISQEKRPGITFGKPEPCAHVHIDAGGELVYGGPQALVVDVNEFKLFKLSKTYEQAGMAYAAYISEEAFSFLGVYVLHINLHTKIVDFGVVSFDKVYDLGREATQP